MKRSNMPRTTGDILTQPIARGIHANGVVLKSLSDASLHFETCVIMRVGYDSPLVNIMFACSSASIRPNVCQQRQATTVRPSKKTRPTRFLFIAVFGT